jgi:hypothetical protein
VTVHLVDDIAESLPQVSRDGIAVVLQRATELGWRIVRTDARGDGLIYVDARDEVVEIAEEWTP